MSGTRCRSAAVVAASLLACAPALAQDQDDEDGIASPRWSYELRGGYIEPDLDDFETFYGDDTETYYGLAGSYRFRDWLELGGELSHMKADGVGFLTTSQQLGGNVEYRLNPVQVFANFIFQGQPRQRVVPYVGIGLTSVVYKQKIEQQPDRDGHTDLGYTARVGLRFMVAAQGPMTGEPIRVESPYWRTYIFLEAQHLSAEVDNDFQTIDLGGDAYMLGFRMEFDMPHRH
jgi:opacity protein-like surface antigen